MCVYVYMFVNVCICVNMYIYMRVYVCIHEVCINDMLSIIYIYIWEGLDIILNVLMSQCTNCPLCKSKRALIALICMYMCEYVCICVYMCVNVCMCVNMCVYACICVCVYVCMYIYIYM